MKKSVRIQNSRIQTRPNDHRTKTTIEHVEFWTRLDFWIRLDTFGHVWIRLDTFGHVFIFFFGHVWILDTFGHVWIRCPEVSQRHRAAMRIASQLPNVSELQQSGLLQGTSLAQEDVCKIFYTRITRAFLYQAGCVKHV